MTTLHGYLKYTYPKMKDEVIKWLLENDYDHIAAGVCLMDEREVQRFAEVIIFNDDED